MKAKPWRDASIRILPSQEELGAAMRPASESNCLVFPTGSIGVGVPIHHSDEGFPRCDIRQSGRRTEVEDAENRVRSRYDDIINAKFNRLEMRAVPDNITYAYEMSCMADIVGRLGVP